jgi:hypothetical protein
MKKYMEWQKSMENMQKIKQTMRTLDENNEFVQPDIVDYSKHIYNYYLYPIVRSFFMKIHNPMV